MNWLKKLFSGTTNSTGPGAGEVDPRSVAIAKAMRPPRNVALPEAKRIDGESVRVWCDKLDKEADRTGNARLRQQAANIRSRFRL